MPNDPRLYMTFPIDIQRHPKIRRLPPEVRWTFVEMNGEARMADNDGVFAAEDAEYLWPVEHLNALVASHPTRPLVKRVGNTYVIREYAKHQQTRADREELSRKRRESGRLGGQAKARKALASAKQPLASAKQVSGKAWQSLAESESEDFTTKTSMSQSSSKRARDSTDAVSLTISDMTRRLAAQRGITDLVQIVAGVSSRCGIDLNADSAFQLCVHLLDKAPTPPHSGQRYVMGALTKSPGEVTQWLYEQAIA